MKDLDLGDLIELGGHVLLIAAVWFATGRLWAVLLAAGLTVLWLRHTWAWAEEEPEQEEPRAKRKRRLPEAPPPIVKNRRLM